MKRVRQKTYSIVCALLSSAVSLVACGGEPSAPVVCDPSRSGEIVFGYQFLEPNVSRISQGEPVLVENGFHYLFVDGACNYWAFNAFEFPAGPFARTRYGALSEEQFAVFDAELMRQPWADIAGEHSRETSLDHPSVAVVWRDEEVASCLYPCEPASSTLRRIVESARALHGELAAETSSAAEEPTVRYFAMSYDALDGFPLTEWEGPTPLSELAVTPPVYSDPYGDHPIATGGDAEELRRIRELYRTGSLGDFGYLSLPITDEGIQYLVWVRDTLPLEDERGPIRPPGLDE